MFRSMWLSRPTECDMRRNIIASVGWTFEVGKTSLCAKWFSSKNGIGRVFELVALELIDFSSSVILGNADLRFGKASTCNFLLKSRSVILFKLNAPRLSVPIARISYLVPSSINISRSHSSRHSGLFWHLTL